MGAQFFPQASHADGAMKTIRLGPKLQLPLDAVTRTTAIVGQRGTGKTSTAVVVTEEALAAGAQAAVVDPTGAWYGLRSSADGKKAGLEVVVFGGHHGDVPLDPGAGAFLARLVIDEGISVVLDLELMTKGKQVQFVAEFAEELYHRNRRALTLVMDEAHRFAPQQLRDPGGYGARCLGAVTDVVTLGRRKGLGAVLISQRPAKINKDVFEQAEIVVAHRLMGPNDRKAIAGWLDEATGNGDATASPTDLPGLERGHALVWAPTYDVYGRYAIRPKRTFDSSATPEIGETVTEPKGRADVDLAAIEIAMADTIEKAKADDPAELRRTIAQLRRHVTELERRPTESVTETIEVPAPYIPGDVIAALDNLARAMGGVDVAAGEVQTLVAGLQNTNGHRPTPQTSGPRPKPARPTPPPSASAPAGTGRAPSGGQIARAAAPGDFQPTSSQQRILDTLAWFEALGIDSPSRAALAPMAGSRPTSGGFKNNLGALRTAGLIDYPTGGRVVLTPTGRGQATPPDVEPTDEALQDVVLAAVTNSQGALLRVLIAEYPHDLPREDLASAVGVPATSGGFKNNLGALRTLELIDYPQAGHVVALPILFPTGGHA